MHRAKKKCFNAKGCALFFTGVKPQTPKSVIVNRYPLLPLRSGGRLTHNPPLLYASHAQGALGVAHCMTSHRGWLRHNRPPREREERLATFTLEQLKSHSWNIRLEPPTHRSVGRLSALYHRLLLQLCKLRHNSPPQDRLHLLQSGYASKGKRPIYRTANYQNYSYGCHLSCVPQ